MVPHRVTADLRVIAVPSNDEAFVREAQHLAERIPAGLGLGPDALAWYERELKRGYPNATVHAQDELARIQPGPTTWYAHNGGPIFRIDTAVDVGLPLEHAFAVYVDRVVEWQTAVRLTAAHMTPQLVGSEYEARFDFLGHTYLGKFRITAADPPRSVALEASGSGIAVWYVTRFEPGALPGTTHVTVKGDYRLPDMLLARIADRLFLERTIAREIVHANETYREICERLRG